MPALRCDSRRTKSNTPSLVTPISETNSKRKQSSVAKDGILNNKRKCCKSTCKIAKTEDEHCEMDQDGFFEIGDRSKPKRRHNPAKWKRSAQKKVKSEMYVQNSNISVPKCVHKRGPFKCNEVQIDDVASIREIFSKRKNNRDQNMYILSQVVVDAVKRHRPRNGSKAKSVTASYFLRLKSAKRIRVCKTAFATVLGVGRDRLTDLIHFYHENGDVKLDSRGGDHKIKKYGGKRSSVVDFIKKLKGRESHYGRNKSQKLYLPHELKSIKNLCNIYNSNKEQPDKVKYGFFKKIFRKNFNLAFGTPRTDVCSFCLRFKYLLHVETDQTKKNLIRSRLRIHKLRSKEFYKLLKERKTHIKSIAGDCQQNQALPKIPDQAAYFSRQLNFYNFTLAENIDDQTQNFAYIWTEDQSKKGSNQIASAVFHKLMNTAFDGITVVRLVFDGCGGQNKNVQMLCMASWWLVNKAPKSIESVQLVFPVTGHSFLPPDRVFGRIEKDIRKEEEILSPVDYCKLIEKHETVVQMGKDWKVYDWKSFAVERFKSTSMLPFKITQTKIFKIKKSTTDVKAVDIKAQKNYRYSNSDYQPVCKKGTNLSSSPALVKEKVIVNEAKLDDVYSLLKNRFGEDWRANEGLSYYRNFFKLNYKPSGKKETYQADDDEEEICSCCDEDNETFFL